MKRLTKIRYRDGETTITWLEDAGDRPTVHKHELVSREDPEPEFFTALDALVPQVLKLLELPADYGAEGHFLVQGLSLSYDKDGRRSVVVTCLRSLAGADAPLVVNTPSLPYPDLDDDKPSLTYTFAASTDDVCARAERFINGARAQQDLFAEKVSEEVAAQLI